MNEVANLCRENKSCWWKRASNVNVRPRQLARARRRINDLSPSPPSPSYDPVLPVIAWRSIAPFLSNLEQKGVKARELRASESLRAGWGLFCGNFVGIAIAEEDELIGPRLSPLISSKSYIFLHPDLYRPWIRSTPRQLRGGQPWRTTCRPNTMWSS